jgi:hypothetical protein
VPRFQSGRLFDGIDDEPPRSIRVLPNVLIAKTENRDSAPFQRTVSRRIVTNAFVGIV